MAKTVGWQCESWGFALRKLSFYGCTGAILPQNDSIVCASEAQKVVLGGVNFAKTGFFVELFQTGKKTIFA